MAATAVHAPDGPKSLSSTTTTSSSAQTRLANVLNKNQDLDDGYGASTAGADWDDWGDEGQYEYDENTYDGGAGVAGAEKARVGERGKGG